MLYNKNIVQDILSTWFWDKIELSASNSVMDLDSEELDQIFDVQADYGILGSIITMTVYDFEVQREDLVEVRETIFGTLGIVAEVEGYAHWDGEDDIIGYGEINLVFEYEFYAEDEMYTDLELEYVY